MKRSYLLFGLLFYNGVLFGQDISDRSLLRQINKTPQLSKAFVGIYIEDLERNNRLISFNSDNYMTPGSNIKLLTFLGAIQTFSKIPALEYIIENDSLAHFRSTGYGLLFHPFYPDNALADFFKVRPKWIYHPQVSKPTLMGSGWSWDDYHYYYAAPRSVFPIYGNSVRGTLGPSGLDLLPLFTSIKHSSARNFERERFKNQFKYNPINWKNKDTIYRPFIPSDSLFIKVLAKATNRDICFAKHSKNMAWKALYTGYEELLYKGLLHDSDNGIAESLLLMISYQKKGVFKSEIAIDSLKTLWQSWLPDPLEWVDGSGISRYNMVTPRTLVSVLQKIDQDFGWENIKKIFPKSNVPGTLKDYEGLENVYAKTGTLLHNHNLSGYWVNAKGKKYAFSIMVNHFTRPTSEIRQGISDLLTWLQIKLK